MSTAARRHLALLVCALAAAFAAFGATASPGSAALLTGSCPGQQLSQPFLPWLDLSRYVLVGDGGFESGASGWALGAGSQVVDGNEPWDVREAGDTHSLQLPAGGQATSPATCIGLLDPTMRFFARSLGGTLVVDATVTIGTQTTTLPVGVVAAGGEFSPTLPLPLLANLTTPLAGGTGSVTLTFTAVGGPVAIDDVYIDPYKVN
jgi:hypothetical protein